MADHQKIVQEIIPAKLKGIVAKLDDKTQDNNRKRYKIGVDIFFWW